MRKPRLRKMKRLAQSQTRNLLHSWYSSLQWLLAVITNYHKLSGLKQHKYILLQFCRAEV